MKRIDHKYLKKQTKKVLIKYGANDFSAESVSKGLTETSLRGVDSHGIRLLPHYLNALKNGYITLSSLLTNLSNRAFINNHESQN